MVRHKSQLPHIMHSVSKDVSERERGRSEHDVLFMPKLPCLEQGRRSADTLSFFYRSRKLRKRKERFEDQLVINPTYTIITTCGIAALARLFIRATGCTRRCAPNSRAAQTRYATILPRALSAKRVCDDRALAASSKAMMSHTQVCYYNVLPTTTKIGCKQTMIVGI